MSLSCENFNGPEQVYPSAETLVSISNNAPFGIATTQIPQKNKSFMVSIIDSVGGNELIINESFVITSVKQIRNYRFPFPITSYSWSGDGSSSGTQITIIGFN